MKIREITNRIQIDNAKLYRDTKRKLFDEYPELSIGGGIGLCAFASWKVNYPALKGGA